MSTHTKGPWAAYQKQGQQGTPLPQWRIHGPGICGAIATVDFDLTQPTCAKQDANVEANACVIAAAPDLLAALRESLTVMESIRQEWGATHDGEYNPFRLKFEAQARHAIAKAEGRNHA